MEVNQLVKRIKVWWEVRRLNIKPPVEYLEIQSTHPPDFVTKGWIPRQVFEDITGCEFMSERQNFIRNDHSEKLHSHPLFVKDLNR